MDRFGVLDRNIALTFVSRTFDKVLWSSFLFLVCEQSMAGRALRVTLNIIVLPDVSFGRCYAPTCVRCWSLKFLLKLVFIDTEETFSRLTTTNVQPLEPDPIVYTDPEATYLANLRKIATNLKSGIVGQLDFNAAA